jgi:hypothetical protein
MDYRCDSSGQQVVHDQALTVALVRVMCTTNPVKNLGMPSYCYPSDKAWYVDD